MMMQEQKSSIFPPGLGEVRWNPISSVQQKPAEWSEGDEKRILQIERIAQQAGCTQKLQEKIHDWLISLRPSWKPSEEQIANATFNDLAEVYERIRTEMLKRHQDIAINIKEGQQ